MIKERFPVFAPLKDAASSGPEKLERPGEMGKALLNILHREWEEDIMMLAATARGLIKENYLPSRFFSGIMRNWADFRKYLLTMHNSDQPIEYDMERFGTTEESLNAISDAITRKCRAQGMTPRIIVATQKSIEESVTTMTPMQIAAWVRGSQRIYSLSEEATNTWVNANYGERTWEDILMPFDSFLIELRKPIQTKTPYRQTCNIHAILVTKVASIDPDYPKGYFECLPLTTGKDNKLPEPARSKVDKKEIKAIAKGQKDPSKLMEIVLRRSPAKVLGVVDAHEFFAFHVEEKERVTSEQVKELTNLIRKIVAGTCIYVTQRRKKVDEPAFIGAPAKPVRLKNLKHMNVITDPAQVLSIGHVHNFDPMAETWGIEYIGGPKSPHHRSAYLRRPPSSPPNAPRTVKVKATVVNRHLLPRDAIPKGTLTKIE